MKSMKYTGTDENAGETQAMEKLGLYKQEKIADDRGAQGNDGPTGNQVPARKPEKLAKGFTIK